MGNVVSDPPYAAVMTHRTLLLLLSLLVLPAAAPSDTPDGLHDALGVRLLGVDGVETTLGRLAAGAPLVVAYTGVGCPISGKYASRLNELAERFGEQGVRFVGVNASPQDTCQAVAKEVEELGLELAVYKDARQELTRTLEARTTTETFLFDAKGRLRYRGAIDDQYDLGAARPAPTANHLANAIAAVLEGSEPAVEATEAPGCALTLLPEDELPPVVTWARDVAPILQENCETCHRPGQVGPFALQTYEQSRGWAEMILSVVEEGRMPPWNADEDYRGVFVNERSLSAVDRQKLRDWVEGGLLPGDPEEAPPPAEWPEGWSIGEPDVVFEMQHDIVEDAPLPEEGWEVPREGVVEYQYFSVDTNYPEDRWVQAVETRAGAPDVVHHILVAVDDPSDPNRRFKNRGDFRSFLGAGVPGDVSTSYPEGYGKKLPAGAKLIFQMHYTPNGKQRFDRSSVALIFCEEVPELEVVTDAVANDRFRIPPNVDDVEVRAELAMKEEVGLIALLPHMHTRGKDFRYLVHYPDGETEEILSVSRYDFNWQETYVLHDPMLLPAGSKIECIGHYDNTANNPNNPDPGKWVRWGDQTFEEMFIGYYDFVRPIE